MEIFSRRTRPGGNRRDTLRLYGRICGQSNSPQAESKGLAKVKIALYLLGVQGLIGAFDTLYYHEWKARLPARGRRAARELALHAARDFLYGVLFISLPRFAWKGKWIALLLGVIGAEIILTLWDFVVEIAVRRDLGDVYAGERVTHATMGILYGAMLATLVPTLSAWWGSPTGLVVEPATVPQWMRIFVTGMGAGVIGSGLRDLYAALQLPGGGWPWRLGDVETRNRWPGKP